MPPAAPRFVTLPDGRRLAYAEYGDPAGRPVLHCHGGLSSRLDGCLLDAGARVRGVRIISPDRPGVGRSDPRPGRMLAEWPRDAAALLDALAIERCAVTGWSLGGQYALATCAALGPRITRAALLGSAVPFDLAGSTAGLSRTDRALLALSARAPALARAGLAGGVRAAPARMLQHSIERTLGPADISALRALPDPLAAARFVGESVRGGTEGVVCEYRLWRAPWGFALADVATEIDVWQGDADTFVPAAYPALLTDALPHATGHDAPGEGHISLVVRRAADILQRM